MINTAYTGHGVKGRGYSARLENIKWAIKLPRIRLFYDLSNPANSKQFEVLIHTTSLGERICIAYPGKESARTGTQCRPWDFFPVVYNQTNIRLPDLKFEDIWDELRTAYGNGMTSSDVAILSNAFYRLAIMEDHIRIGKFSTVYRQLPMVPNTPFSQFSHQEDFFQLQINQNYLDWGNQNLPLMASMSFEAFLHYNDLLGFQEDCKYYYRDCYVNGKKWMNGIGKPNNLLTHINVLGTLAGKVHFSDLFAAAIRGRGVAPVSNRNLKSICQPWIV